MNFRQHKTESWWNSTEGSESAFDLITIKELSGFHPTPAIYIRRYCAKASWASETIVAFHQHLAPTCHRDSDCGYQQPRGLSRSFNCDFECSATWLEKHTASVGANFVTALEWDPAAVTSPPKRGAEVGPGIATVPVWRESLWPGSGVQQSWPIIVNLTHCEQCFWQGNFLLN